MMELTIDGQVFQFNFGIGFVREIDRKSSIKAEGVPGNQQNTGLQYAVGSLLDGDVEVLIDVLDVANKGQDPRVTKKLLDTYIDDEGTDIDALFEEVLDFLKKGNASKKRVAALMERLAEAEDAKQ